MQTTITLEKGLAARVAEQAREAGQPLDSFVDTVLRAVVDDIRWEGRWPVLRVPPDSAPVTVEDVDRLLNEGDA
jgi:hypothetical protein